MSISRSRQSRRNHAISKALSPAMGYCVCESLENRQLLAAALPVVSVTAPVANASEDGVNGVLRVTRNVVSSQALSITYTLAGSATPYLDYVRPTTIRIPANKTFVNVPIQVLHDNLIEGTENVVLRLLSSTAYKIGTPSSATVNIADATPAVLSITPVETLASEVPGHPATFVITRTGNDSSDLRVQYNTSGDAVAGTDYAFLGDIVIPAGQGSVTVNIDPTPDNNVENDQTMQFAILPSSDYQLGAVSTFTASIVDASAPIVSVVVSDPEAIKPNTPGSITFTRFGNLHTDIQVNFTVSGTARPGQDYRAITSIVIPAGQDSVEVPIIPMSSTVVTGDTTVTLTLAPGSGYTVGADDSGTVVIQDNQRPQLSVATIDASASAPNDPVDTARFMVVRFGDTQQLIRLKYSLTGTAIEGSDYEFVGIIYLPPGESQVPVDILPVDPSVPVGDRTVIFTILPDPANYNLGAAGTLTAQAVIHDNTAPLVSVIASQPNAAEPNINGQYTVTRVGDLRQPLSLNFHMEGTAVQGVQYQAISSITIPAGQASVLVPLTVIDDRIGGADKTATLVIDDGSTYVADSNNNSATVTIRDNDGALVNVAATVPDAHEPATTNYPGNNGVFTITRDGPSTQNLTVAFHLTGSAVAGRDYQPITHITIPAGQSSVTVPVIPIDNFTVDPLRTVTLVLDRGNNYTPVTPNSATVTIHDDSPPVVTVAASVPDATERRSNGEYTITVSGDWNQPMRLNFHMAGTAVQDADYVGLSSILIPVPVTPTGTYQIKVPLQLLGNPMPQVDDLTATLVLDAGTGYDLSSGASDSSATVTIHHTKVPPLITVTSATPTVDEGGADGVFVLTRYGDTSQLLTLDPGVDYTLTGTATAGADYYNLGRLVFAPGQAQIRVVLRALADHLIEDDETVTLTLKTPVDLATANFLDNSASVLLGAATVGFASRGDYVTGTSPVSIASADFNNDGRKDVAVANSGSNTISVLMSTGGGTLASRVDYAVGLSPASITTGDFNGDGNVDLAVANSGSDTVSVLLGNGFGGFGARADFVTGSTPDCVAAADVNGDGKTDLAVTNSAANSVSVLLGDGTGGFAPRVDYITGLAPSSVVIGDFTGDSKMDLAVANAGSNTVGVLIGDGTGIFTLNVGQLAPTGAGPRSLVAAYIDGDTNLDIVVANSGSNSVSLLTGDGKGGFANKVDFATGAAPVSVTAGDFSGDGKTDIAVANAASNTVSVLLNNATGGFVARVDYATGTAPASVTTADINADGSGDLAIANFGSNTVSVLIGNGVGGFTAKGNSTGAAPHSVALGDFNGDGDVDIAVANSASNTVSVLLGDGAGGFAAKVDYPTGVAPSSVSVGDFNRDGNLDLVVANLTDNTVSVLRGLGGGRFAPRVNYPTGQAPSSVAVADFNSDGKLDLAVTNSIDNTVSVLLGVGVGNFAPKVDYASGAGPSAVVVADLNTDGAPDLAVTNSVGNSISVLINDGKGVFLGKTDYITGTAPRSVAVADVTGDGKVDLVVANSGSNTVSVLAGAGGGRFMAKVDYATGAAPYAVSVVDINRDSQKDIAVADLAGNTVSVLTNDRSGGFNSKVDYATGTAPYTIAATDLDADGLVDFVVADSGGNAVSVLMGSLTIGYTTRTDYTTGTSPYSAAAADFNGDGTMDLAVVNSATNTVSVLDGDGTGTLATRADYATGAAPYAVIAADVNGDGKMDLIVANHGGNSVSVLLSRGRLGFAPKVDYATGLAPSAVTAADFNGDGKLDLAVADSGSNTISVLMGNGSGGFSAKVDYATGALPVSITAGDFNRDGRIDLAVANFTGNTVSVLRGNGTGGFAAKVDYATSVAPRSVVAADLNGDGKMDLAVANSGANTVSVLIGNGAGVFAGRVDYATGAAPYSVTAADLNGDGILDLAVANSASSTVSVLTGQSAGGFAAKVDYVTGSTPYCVVAADFNRQSLASTIIYDHDIGVVVNRPDAAKPGPGYAGSNGQFTIVRGNSDQSRAYTINFHIVSKAILAVPTAVPGPFPGILPGADFTLSAVAPATLLSTGGTSGTITMPAGVTEIKLTVVPLGGNPQPDDTDIQLVIDPGSNYTVGSTDVAATPPYGTGIVTLHKDGLSFVSVVATQSEASKPDGAGALILNGQFTFTRTGDLSQPLSIKYKMSGNATEVLDYDPLGVVTFPVNVATVSVLLIPNANNLGTSTQTAIITLDPGDGYGVGAVSGTASVTIYDEFPLVTVTATRPNAAEPGTNGEFTVTRYGKVTNALTVGYAMQGTANVVSDYRPLGTITIPAGAASVVVPLTVVDDTIHEQTETARLFLSPSPMFAYYRAIVHSATVTITDDDAVPVISITASKPNASLGVTDGEFVITIAGGQQTAFPLTFTLGGTAVPGTDYQTIPAITVLPGIHEIRIPVKALLKSNPGPNTTVTLTIVGGGNYTTVPAPASATVNLLSQSSRYVTVQATDPVATASGGNSGTFTISRTGPTTLAQIVSYTLGGTAVNGVDYAQIGQIVIPAGQSSVLVPVTSIRGVAGVAKTVTLSIASSLPGYLNFPGLQTATVFISAGLTVTATVSQTWEVSSPAGIFTITRGVSDVSQPLVVNYTVGGTAVPDVDYQGIPSQVTIPAGQDSVNVRIFGIRDDSVDGVKTVTLTLLPSGGLMPDAPLDNATVEVIDTTQVSVIALAATATQSGTPGVFSFQRIGDTTGPLVIPYVLSGTAVEGVDYQTIGQIVIPAGSFSVDVPVTAFSSGFTDTSPTITLTILRTVDVVPFPSASATITIIQDVSQIGVVASTPTTREGGDPGVFTFTRNGNLSQPLEVPYRLSGSALEGSDYQELGHIIIPAGRASIDVDLIALTDSFVEGNETVTIEVLNSMQVLIGASATASITIIDTTAPLVSVATSVRNAAEEGPAPGIITFTRIGNDEEDLTLTYLLGGSAVEGSDYQTVGTITIPAHTTTLNVPIMPIDDNLPEPTESVTFTLLDGSNYTASDHNQAQVSILDNDLPTVSVVGTDPIGQEGQTPANNAMITFWRTGDLSQAMTISYNMVGTAQSGVDFSVPFNVTIPFEKSFVQVPVTVIDNAIPDGTRTVTFTVAPTPGVYKTAAGTDATTVTILDNEVPRLSVTVKTPLATELGQSPGVVTIARQGTLEVPLTVAYTVGGTATKGTDYQVPGTITIPAGVASIDVPITPIDDTLSEGPETVVFALQASLTGSYSLDPLNANTQATITIADNDPPTVTVAATQPNASEAGVQGQYTFTRVGNMANDLPITCQFAGTATAGVDYQPLNIVIPASQASVTVPVIPIDDALVEPTETLALTILPSPGLYLVGAPAAATVNILDNDDNVAPTVTAFTKPKIVAGANSPTFTVTYTDDSKVDRTSLGNGNLLIIGPKSYRQYAVFVSANVATNAPAITATYRIVTPGATWDAADSGTYTVYVQPNQVKDISGNAMANQSVGTFAVSIAAKKAAPKKTAAKTAAAPLAAAKPFVFNTSTTIADLLA